MRKVPEIRCSSSLQCLVACATIRKAEYIYILRSLTVSNTFEEQYAPMLKEVFTIHARQQLQQGADGLALARGYAEQGKPDFALAFLLLLDIPDDEKREALAQAYERRARLSDEKA